MSFSIRIFVICVALLMGGASMNAATYYIDFNAGNDANNGTSTSSPWKRHPFMRGFAGKYVRAGGDRFIFKGGVVWTASFPMTISVSGPTSTSRDYYGIDKNWFTGSSWTRPVFDGGGGSDNMILMMPGVSNIIIDSLELRNYANALGIFCTGPTYTMLTNLYIHKWFRGGATTDGNKGGIYNNYAGMSGGRLTEFLLTHSVIDNSDGGRDFGVCIRGAGEVAFSKLGYAPELLLHGGYSVHDTEFYQCTTSFLGDAAQHPNVAYLDNFNGTQTLPGGKVYFYNNLIRDIRAGNAVQLIYPNLGTGGLGNNGEMYIYNNVVVNAPNARTIPIDNYGAPSGAAYKFFVWNNTFENTQSGGGFISVVYRSGVPAPHTISYFNNHFIGSGSPYVASGTLNTFSGNNYQHTSASTANTAGFAANTFYAPQSSTAVTVGKGTNFSSSTLKALSYDTSLGDRRTPKARPGSGAWDIGAFSYAGAPAPNQPAIALSPARLDFGVISAGTSKELKMTIENSGSQGTTLSGSASVSAPFTIVSGGSYNLAAGASQSVTIRYSPTAAGTHSLNVNFTGGGGGAVAVTGTAYPIMSSLTFGADAGAVSAPFVSSGGYVSQPIQTGLSEGGRADYGFNITTAGDYVVEIVTDAPDDGANSAFINIDSEPVDPDAIWHSPLTAGPTPVTVSWQGKGTWDKPELTPKVFTLATGAHRLIIRGREANMRLGQISIVPRKAAGVPPAITTQPVAATVTAGQTATFTVGASGTAPLQYQWQRNSTNISGATATAFTTAATSTNDNGAVFRVLVANASGSVTSAPAVLTVRAPAPTPVISVSPVKLDFGVTAAGTSREMKLTVQNSGLQGTTLSGSASVSAPFTIVSGGSYNLSAGAGQTVTVRYSPTAAGSHTENVTFTGGGGALAAVSGVAYPMMSSLSFAADAGSVSEPFISSGGYIYQPVQTGLTNGGRADYGFNISIPGDYLVEIVTDAPSEGANSAFINVDSEPLEPDSIWHAPVTTGPAPVKVSWQGKGTWDKSELVPKVFNLTAGPHRLIIRGREADMRLGQISIVQQKTAAVPPAITNQPVPASVTVGETATFSVGASGTAPLVFQWQRNNSNITGATASAFTTGATVANDDGAVFRVVVTNAAGAVTSVPVVLTVMNPTPGVAGHWTFDEGAGLTAKDSSGAGRHGTLLKATGWTNGVFGNALRFTAADADDRLNLGTFSVPGTNLSVSAWIRLDAVGADPHIVAKAVGTNPDDYFWSLEVEDGPPARLGFRVNTTSGAVRLVGGDVPLNQWVHVVGVFDGTSMRLYRNGTQVSSVAQKGNLLTGPAAVWVGDNPAQPIRPFAGTVDDLRIYSKALTAKEVKALYDAQPKPKPPKGVRIVK